MNGVISRPGIDIRDLTLRFGDRVIFERLNFSIEGGTFVAMLGASGAGKTSLLKIIAGLAKATSGSVTASDRLPVPGRIAYMGPRALLSPWLRVRENITPRPRLPGETADRALAEHPPHHG